MTQYIERIQCNNNSSTLIQSDTFQGPWIYNSCKFNNLTFNSAKICSIPLNTWLPQDGFDYEIYGYIQGATKAALNIRHHYYLFSNTDEEHWQNYDSLYTRVITITSRSTAVHNNVGYFKIIIKANSPKVIVYQDASSTTNEWEINFLAYKRVGKKINNVIENVELPYGTFTIGGNLLDGQWEPYSLDVIKGIEIPAGGTQSLNLESCLDGKGYEFLCNINYAVTNGRTTLKYSFGDSEVLNLLSSFRSSGNYTSYNNMPFILPVYPDNNILKIYNMAGEQACQNLNFTIEARRRIGVNNG
jgi:hypothetical protein